MELNSKHLEALRLIRGAMINPADGWDSALEGQLTLSPTTYVALDLLIGDGLLDGLVQVGRSQRDWTTFSRGSTEVIHISLPLADWGLGDCVVYRNLGALIGRGQFLTVPPNVFYLIDEAVIIPPDQGNDAVRNYLRAVAFAHLLVQQADHIDHAGGTPRLVFLHKVSITIPIVYDETDLAEPIEGLDALQALLASSEHKEQKRSILKAALYDLLATEKEGNRFCRLLGHSKELSQAFRERYQLFVCEFDFDEVREELEEKRRDYLTRLNATFNDMGAKLLSIPAAFYTALTQMKPLPAAGSAFEVVVFNTVVTVAVITVTVYILMLLNSQRHTLMATSEEYAGLFARWRSRLKFAEQQEQIDKTLRALDQRKRRLLAYFAITTSSVIGTLSLTLGLYVLRLFRWESPLWDAVHALKAMLSP